MKRRLLTLLLTLVFCVKHSVRLVFGHELLMIGRCCAGCVSSDTNVCY